MNQYKTNSLALSATLNIFFPVVEVDKTNPRESIFIFTDSEALKKIVTTFWDRTLTVSPYEIKKSK